MDDALINQIKRYYETNNIDTLVKNEIDIPSGSLKQHERQVRMDTLLSSIKEYKSCDVISQENIDKLTTWVKNGRTKGGSNKKRRPSRRKSSKRRKQSKRRKRTKRKKQSKRRKRTKRKSRRPKRN